MSEGKRRHHLRLCAVVDAVACYDTIKTCARHARSWIARERSCVSWRVGLASRTRMVVADCAPCASLTLAKPTRGPREMPGPRMHSHCANRGKGALPFLLATIVTCARCYAKSADSGQIEPGAVQWVTNGGLFAIETSPNAQTQLTRSERNGYQRWSQRSASGRACNGHSLP